MSNRRAQDERIEGTPDGTSAISEIMDVPDAPTIGAATNVGTSRAYNNGAATVAFTANTTGGTVTTYTATSTPGSFTGTAASSPVTVAGLQSQTSYTFAVTGANSTGTSPETSATSSITATTVPQAPTIGTATKTGVTTATVGFTAGATGGSAITGYTVTSSPGSVTATGTSPVTVTGLTGATSYTFTVTATNANGTSAASSASNSITTDTPKAGYIASGLAGGGRVSTITKVSLPDDTGSTLAATLAQPRFTGAGFANSGTAGYFTHGDTYTITTVDKLTFSNDSRSTFNASLGVLESVTGFANSGTAGYTGGGFTTIPSVVATIRKITFSNDSSATIGATLTTTTMFFNQGMANSGTAGYFCGGFNSGVAYYSRVDKLAFSNDSKSTLAATLTSGTSRITAMANSGTAGYAGGGNTSDGSTYLSNVDKITFSNDSKSNLGNILTATYVNGAGFANSGTAGYFAGGSFNSAVVSNMQKIAFSNDSRTSTGNVLATASNLPLGCANSGTL